MNVLLLYCFYAHHFHRKGWPKLSSQDGAVPKLGDKAAELVAEAQQGGPILAKAVEAALEPLFLRQVRETSSLKDRNLFEKRKKMENMKNLWICNIWYRLLKKRSLNELKWKMKLLLQSYGLVVSALRSWEVKLPAKCTQIWILLLGTRINANSHVEHKLIANHISLILFVPNASNCFPHR